MKKLLTICLTLAPCALMAATNKIKMVSYFPVPYVAYSRVSAGQMDVGLTSACSMKLGCSESQSPLDTPNVNVQSGKLELNGGRGILGTSLTLGAGHTGTGHLSFSNVRIATGNMESVNANAMAVTNLNLFGRAFPSCKDANSASNGQMSWKSLKLKGASNQELYLVCGDLGGSTACQPDDPRGKTYTESCPLGQTGEITYTWNYTTCRYQTTSTCASNLKTCFVSYTWNEYKTDTTTTETSGSWISGASFNKEKMLCGGQQTTWKTIDAECEVGKQYVYNIAYHCRASGINSQVLKTGYYCVKCGQTSEENCITKDKLTKEGGCSSFTGGSSSGGTVDKQPGF